MLVLVSSPSAPQFLVMEELIEPATKILSLITVAISPLEKSSDENGGFALKLDSKIFG